MKRDSKLSSILHVLLHMAASEKPLTSDEMAAFLGSHPVVVRRVLAGLRERGYVASGKGHRGGWTIACDLEKISLHDIYQAVGEPTVFAMGNRVESPQCLVEQVVNQSLASAFDEAEALLVARFRQVSLADLSAQFKHRYPQHPKDHPHADPPEHS